MIMRVSAAIWKTLTLSCDESTRLMSAVLDEPLPWSDRTAVLIHAAICGGCRRFRRQIRFLGEAARLRGTQRPFADGAAPGSASLSATARRRIEDVVRREIGENDR
jgi:hypothetical protein